MPITGLDLRAERRTANVTVTAVAKGMGLSRQTIHVMETQAVLTIERVAQYRAALHDAIVASAEHVA